MLKTCALSVIKVPQCMKNIKMQLAYPRKKHVGEDAPPTEVQAKPQMISNPRNAPGQILPKTSWQSETPIRTVLYFNTKAPGQSSKGVLFLFAFFFSSSSTSPQDKQDDKNEGSDVLRGTISNLPAAHSWALSHLKVL